MRFPGPKSAVANKIILYVDKDTYFKGVKEAGSLQTRWKEEIGIDIIQRVIDLLHKITGMPVRRAMEGDREYFAGVVRAIDSGIQIHSDYAPYVSPFTSNTLGYIPTLPRLNPFSKVEVMGTLTRTNIQTNTRITQNYRKVQTGK